MLTKTVGRGSHWDSGIHVSLLLRLPERHRALSSSHTTAMRSRDLIITIAHPASMIVRGPRIHSHIAVFHVNLSMCLDDRKDTGWYRRGSRFGSWPSVLPDKSSSLPDHSEFMNHPTIPSYTVRIPSDNSVKCGQQHSNTNSD